eukprot:7854523-Pyramimonas_sp.AAC.1
MCIFARGCGGPVGRGGSRPPTPRNHWSPIPVLWFRRLLYMFCLAGTPSGLSVILYSYRVSIVRGA